MAAAGHRRHWIIIGAPSVTIVLLLCMSIPAVTSVALSTEELTCKDDEYPAKENKYCCNKCLPGHKLVKECSAPGQRSDCTKCPEGQFIDQVNYSHNCLSCRKCKPHVFEEEVSKCAHNKNTICRCKDGYYRSPIDTSAFECIKCTTCGATQETVHNCSAESNTVCKCKDDHYNVKKTCLPCTSCTPKCKSHCPSTQFPVTEPPNTSSFLINVIAAVVVAALLTLVLVVIVTHLATKRQTKRKLLSQSDQSTKLCQEISVHSEEPSDHSLMSVPQHTVTNQEPLNLPDCVPLEINIPEVIYTVLELVPVLQVKQLVRSLGVTDTVIERAELDHRSSKEAHYQMLRAWAEKGTHVCRGGQGSVLHRPLLHELLGKLRQMHLEQTAEEIETKYSLL